MIGNRSQENKADGINNYEESLENCEIQSNHKSYRENLCNIATSPEEREYFNKIPATSIRGFKASATANSNLALLESTDNKQF